MLGRYAVSLYTRNFNFTCAPEYNVTFPYTDFYGTHKRSSGFLYRIATETG